MKFYSDTIHVGPLGVYPFAPPDVRESMVYGKPVDFSYLVAVTDLRAGVQMECGRSRAVESTTSTGR
jgi:hypothetical protein